LVDQGYSSLAGRDDRPEWAHIWEPLAGLGQAGTLPSGISLQALVDQGYSWLTGRDDRPDWAHVWESLAELGQAGTLPSGISLQALVDQGYSCLTRRDALPQWSVVWETLVAVACHGSEQHGSLLETDKLVQLARRWLVGKETRADWSFVWQGLYAVLRPTSPDHWLVDALLPWLWPDRNRGLGEWDKLFEQALDLGYRAPDFLRLGAEWCLLHSAEPQVHPLAAKILGACPDDPALRPLAEWLEGWLQGQPPLPTARFAAQFLAKHLRKRRSVDGWASALQTAAKSSLRRWRDAYLELTVGAQCTAVVVRTKGRSVFAVANGAEGVVLPTSIAERLGSSDSVSLKPGDKLQVAVVSVDPQNMKAAFALRSVERRH
jgi:hypothetical protein